MSVSPQPTPLGETLRPRGRSSSSTWQEAAQKARGLLLGGITAQPDRCGPCAPQTPLPDPGFFAMSGKTLVIDCRAHTLGRLSSIVAKELLRGTKVVLLRCEKVNIAGTFGAVKARYLKTMNIRTNFNHKRGPFHERSPAAVVRRTIRGMVPHRTARGMEALRRLRVYEGVPPAYQASPRVVAPSALSVLGLARDRPRVELDRLCHELGWQHSEDVAFFEAQRREAAGRYWQEATAVRAKVAEDAKADAEIQKLDQALAKYGY